MKQIVSIILVAIIGFFLFTALYFTDNEQLSFNKYGDVDLDDRVSGRYVAKNVMDGNDVVEFGKSKDLEDGSANIVTSIVVDYRSFDTLGEVTVLFVSALGISLLMSGKRKRQAFAYEPSFILKQGARIIFAIMLVFGIYVFTHGHLTPGGGFPGGSILAAAVLLLYFADNEFTAKIEAFKIAEGLAGSLYIVLGLIGIAAGGYFLSSFLPTGIVGDLFSAGIIPIVYVLIGLKVGSEVSGMIGGFAAGEDEG
ncbi:MAG: Na(+)/H(+) antiporter subunit B [Saccharofermentanales bacterium]